MLLQKDGIRWLKSLDLDSCSICPLNNLLQILGIFNFFCISSNYRFEKLRKLDFFWIVQTLDNLFPEVKENLHMLTDVAQNLQLTGSVSNVRDMTTEERTRWKSAGLSDLLTIPNTPNQSTSSLIPERPARPLGMLGMRR